MLKPIFIFCLFFFAIPSFAQKNEVKLPVEINYTIKGIESKIYFLKIAGTPSGTFADMIIGFQNPETKEWIFFDASHIPISQEGFKDSFQIKLRDQFKGSDTHFVNDILQPQPGHWYLWKCGCNDSLPNLPI